jgi:hypothetical protein
MNGAKRSAEAVGCQKTSVEERSALDGSNRESGGRRSGSENVGLSNKNIGENPMPIKSYEQNNIISEYCVLTFTTGGCRICIRK